MHSALNTVSFTDLFSDSTSSGRSVDVIMASEAAQTVLELGLLRVDVERAARLWASRNSKCTDVITLTLHDDVIKWIHFSHYWPFVSGIYRSPVDSPHKGQWHGALMFSSICAWANDWANNRDTGDLGRHCAYYDVTLMAKSVKNKPQRTTQSAFQCLEI